MNFNAFHLAISFLHFQTFLLFCENTPWLLEAAPFPYTSTVRKRAHWRKGREVERCKKTAWLLCCNSAFQDILLRCRPSCHFLSKSLVVHTQWSHGDSYKRTWRKDQWDPFNSFLSLWDMQKRGLCLTLTCYRRVLSAHAAEQETELKMELGWMAMDIIPSQYCLVFFPLHLGHDDQLGCIKKWFLYMYSDFLLGSLTSPDCVALTLIEQPSTARKVLY